MGDDKHSKEEKKKQDETISQTVSGVGRMQGTLKARLQTKEEEAPPLWLLSFTDIMALMLTFFVLLYAMSVPQEEEWKELATAFDVGFSTLKTSESFQGNQTEITIDKLDLSRALNLEYLKVLIEELLSENNELKNIIVIPQSNRLIISLPEDLLFEPGKAAVLTKGKKALFSLGGVLARIRNRIEIVGHTDPRPIKARDGAMLSTNWELSLARALSVAAVMEDVGYSRDMMVRGISSARYDELSDTLPEQERLSYARRVDIVIMKDDGNKRFLLQ